MRTTITINDDLLELAKRKARAKRTTLGKVIEDALRAALFNEQSDRPEQPFKLVTFDGDGPHSGIDLDRTSALLAAEDVETYRRRR